MVFITMSLKAQVPYDNQLWTGVNVNYKINKKWKIILNPETRLGNNISDLRTFLTDVEARFSLSKRWSLKGGIRYSLKPQTDHKLRGVFDIKYKWSKKKRKLSFSNRLRTQYAYGLVSSKSDFYLRNKTQFGYNMSKLVDPYFGGEIFFKVDRREFRQFRIFAGLDWKINKTLNVNTFYILQREIFNKNPQGDHIYGISLGINLKKSKRQTSSNLD